MRKKVFILLVTVWVFLAFIYTAYNSVKSVSEFREWYFLSDTQKRDKIFDGKYTVILDFNAQITDNKQTYIYSEDYMNYFLTRYYLSPKKIHLIKEDSIGQLYKIKKPIYLISYGKMFDREFKLLASDSARSIFLYTSK